MVSDFRQHVFAEDGVAHDRGKTSDETDLPEGWSQARLGNVTSLTRKPKGFRASAEAIPFIPMAQIPESSLFISDWELRKPSEVKSGTFIRDGDVLLAKITPCLENGKQGIVRGLPGGWGYATTEVFPIQPSDRVDPEYLSAFLKEASVRRFLAARMEGTTGRQRLPKFVLEEIEITLPPLPEQRAIAHVLRTVQQAREATEQVIEATRELKRSLMRHLFTYGPVPVEEADQVSLKETEIGSVPEHWVLGVFKDVVTIGSGQVDPREQPYSGMVHVGPENIEQESGRIHASAIAGELGLISGKYLFTPDHVLYSKIRPYLKKVGLPDFAGVCSADMYPLTPNPDTIQREFLFQFLLSEQFTRQATSYQNRTGIPKINRQQLGSIPVPIPPAQEQAEIVELLAGVDRKLDIEIQRRAALQALFDSLLHHLMTGKVRVPISEEITEPEEVTV